MLRFAKSLGGKLIVGINSDRTTRLLKGKDRPINNEKERKKVLEQLKDVDKVVIFDDIESIGTIMKLKPDILVKGGEWTADEVRQRDSIPNEIDVKVFKLVDRASTTDIIRKIKEAEAWKKGGINK